MQILVFSDNHRNRENIIEMISKYPNIDRIISLGDSEMSKVELSNMNIFGVRGNYPFEPQFPYDLFFDFEGFKVFFTHGHLYSVKSGIQRIYEVGKEKDSDLICFGHTHSPFLELIDDVILLNPGSIAFPKGFKHPTFSLITIKNYEMIVEIIDLESHVSISTIKKTKRR